MYVQSSTTLSKFKFVLNLQDLLYIYAARHTYLHICMCIHISMCVCTFMDSKVIVVIKLNILYSKNEWSQEKVEKTHTNVIDKLNQVHTYIKYIFKGSSTFIVYNYHIFICLFLCTVHLCRGIWNVHVQRYQQQGTWSVQISSMTSEIERPQLKRILFWTLWLCESLNLLQ